MAVNLTGPPAVTILDHTFEATRADRLYDQRRLLGAEIAPLCRAFKIAFPPDGWIPVEVIPWWMVLIGATDED